MPSDVGVYGTNLRVIEADLASDARWLQYVASRPESLVFHHPAWLRTLEEEYGKTCLALACEDAHGQFQGVLPLFYTCGMPLNLFGRQGAPRLSSLPRTPVAGPLYSSTPAMVALIRAAMERVRELSLQLEIKLRVGGLEEIIDGLHCIRWRTSYSYTLPQGSSAESGGIPEPRKCRPCSSCRELRFGNSRNHLRIKCSVNKALKLGVEVRLADNVQELRAWYELYLESMRANVVPARPYRFFQSLWKYLWPLGLMELWIAERSHLGCRRMIAGIIILGYGRTAFYAYAGCRREDFDLRPNDLLHWEAIRGACRHGYKLYDFGEVAEDHPTLALFKKKWGTNPVQLYRYYYPTSCDSLAGGGKTDLVRGIAEAAWRKLPLKVTAFAGEWIYRHL